MADPYRNGFANQINDILNDALRTGNFGMLNRNINGTIRRAIHDDPEIKLSYDEDIPEAEIAPVNQKIPVNHVPAGMYSAPILMVIGAFGIGVFASGAFLAAMATFYAFGGSDTTITSIVLAILAVACGGILAKGIGLRKRLRRFREYQSAMGNDEFCEIRMLAAQCNVTKEEATQELDQMIQKRMFLEGHFDDRKEWFIGNNAMYRRYLEAQRNYEDKQREKAQADAAKASRPADEVQLQKVLEQGRKSVQKIKDANTALPGEEISNQLTRLEDLVKRIFERVEEKPSLLPQIQKFMDYYLPTTIKLVDAYRQLEEKNITSEAATKAKGEIEQTLKTIEDAFRQLQENLYKETVMDVKADISVIKRMLARDGLTERDFDSVQ